MITFSEILGVVANAVTILWFALERIENYKRQRMDRKEK